MLTEIINTTHPLFFLLHHFVTVTHAVPLNTHRMDVHTLASGLAAILPQAQIMDMHLGGLGQVYSML